MEKTYIGTYKVVKIFRVSQRHNVLTRNLSISEARELVKRYPNSNNHIVVFMKQFTSEKYYV